MALWKCGGCGYIHEGDNPPAACPHCGAPPEKFSKLDDSAQNLILRARLTNSLHEKIYALLDEVERLAQIGKDDNLDPFCLSLFEAELHEARILKQRIKAEEALHVQKGKWG